MFTMAKPILTINSGSSSLKASFFAEDGSRRNFRYEHLGQCSPRGHAEAFDRLMTDLGGDMPTAVGHRIVHGGEIVDAAQLVDSAERKRLESITYLAPLYMPGNLLGVDLCCKHFDVPQIACFDTAFHATLPELAWRLPIPRELGIRRYGFHGLNFAHVAGALPGLIGDIARRRVVVAHLGDGASLCLMEKLKSVDTTMGYTPAGGIVMGTRSGDLDPGVMLELAKRYDAEALTDLVYHRMGLIALSDGLDSEMSVLVESRKPAASFALEYYCRQVCAAIGALAAKAAGIDALVFTGCIGERASLIRFIICGHLKFLGFKLNHHANHDHDSVLNAQDSKPILKIAADEEGMICKLVEQAT